jgi:hypothetical protein
MRILSLFLICYPLTAAVGDAVQYGPNSIVRDQSDNILDNESLSLNGFTLLDTKHPDALTFHLYEDQERYRLPELQPAHVGKGSPALNTNRLQSLDVLTKSHSYSQLEGFTRDSTGNYSAKPEDPSASQPKLFSSLGKKETIFLPLGVFVVIKKKF